MIQAIIFDLDGVIIASEKPTFILLQRIIRKYGYELKDAMYSKRIGRKISAFVHEIYENVIPIDIQNKIIKEFYQEYAQNTEKYISVIPSTVQFVKNYQGPAKLGLVSVSSKKEIQKILKSLGIISCFNFIVSSDDVSLLKPDPEMYLKAARLYNLTPGICVAIEDSRIGVESACRAGFQTYVLLNGLNNKKDFGHLATKGFIASEKDLHALDQGRKGEF
ncbi:MAG: HAD family phosphatase [Patescibacteria group bacterium]|nr:HAD family phosphatase [Patescibacteria group bacterium]